jgi:X8 domain-containing protein
MMQSIDCTVDPKATREDTFLSASKLCKQNQSICVGTNFNVTEGQYGSFLMRNSTESSSWIYQQNYIAHGNDSAACSSAGVVIQQATHQLLWRAIARSFSDRQSGMAMAQSPLLRRQFQLSQVPSSHLA